MALFFDAGWFDAKLAERGLSRAVLAAVGGMAEADLALAYKDQREVSAAEVAAFAELLGVTAAEVAHRAGISTPTPQPRTALRRFTIVLDYDGGTYVDQVMAQEPAAAVAAWRSQASAGLADPLLESISSSAALEAGGLTPLEGLAGVWCHTAMHADKLALLHVILTGAD